MKEKIGVYLNLKYGVGRTTINKLCCKYNMERSTLVSEIQKQDLLLINKYIENNCFNKEEEFIYYGKLVEKELKIYSLKGFCYKNGLPVNGQRTKTNGRTAKNKKILTFLKKGKKKNEKNI